MEEFVTLIDCYKCFLCEGFLSIFPVYLHKRGGICGRCTVPPDLQMEVVYNDIYEALAQFVKFPCRYQDAGCLELLRPSKMRQHETSCRYRQYRCPTLNENCPWKGPLDEVFDHYEDKHSSFALSNSRFELDLIRKYQENYLLFHFEDVFVLQIRFDDKDEEFWCSLFCLNWDDKFRNYFYKIEFIKHFGDRTYCLPEKPIVARDYKVFDETEMQKISVKQLMEELRDPILIICSVNIYRKESAPKPKRGGKDKKSLSYLECPICEELMIPPIFQCLTGHTICNICKKKVTECPMCRAEIKDTRNYALETMSTQIEYECKYYDYGCEYVSNSDKIKQHESSCKFGPYECPLSGYAMCKWKGPLDEVMVHAEVDHTENILAYPTITYLCDDLDNYADNDCFLIKDCNQIFLMYFTYKASIFSWTVQYVGPVDEARNYSFHLDFNNKTTCDRRIYFKRPCSSLTKYEDAFKNDDEVIRLERRTLEPLIDSFNLTYFFHVTHSQ